MSRRANTPPHIEGFEYLEVLGTGGSADVYKFRQSGLGREVAVKVLLADGLGHAAFDAEASVMARLSNHPSIVSIFQAGRTEDDRPFLVMEYCPPPHLGTRVRSRPLTVSKALEISIQLAGAVETAHRMGILHRDIKPANVLTTQFGRAALTDFGIASAGPAGTSGLPQVPDEWRRAAPTGQSGGGMSVPWAPPEQLTEGQAMGPSSDVWSLAATLWTTLVGHAPFHLPEGPNDVMAMAGRVRRADLPPTGRPDVPPLLERTLRTAMAKDPEHRFSTALAFARALQAVQVEARLPVTSIDVLSDQQPEVNDDLAGHTRATGIQLSAGPADQQAPASQPHDIGAPHDVSRTDLYSPFEQTSPPGQWPPSDQYPGPQHSGPQHSGQPGPARPAGLHGPALWAVLSILILGLGVAIGAVLAALF